MSDFIIIAVIVFCLLVIFEIYKDSKSLKGKEKPQVFRNKRVRYSDNDFLGDAAEFKKKGLAAIKSKKYNEAWRLFHKQKDSLMGHANEHRFNIQESLALDASVSENLANILRLEKKHTEALVHIIYWVSTSFNRTKIQNNKLNSCFNRAKITQVELPEIESFIAQNPDFRSIRNKVDEWSN